jgi:uncharacterized protein
MINLSQDSYFTGIAEKITSSGRYPSLKQWTQHAHVSTYSHSVWVAMLAYKMAKKLHLKADYPSLIRGSLLHDYYLYDWHDKNKGFRGHGFKHPAISLQRASEDYSLNDIERDMIKKHMFPLTPFPPRYTESVCLCLCDKVVSVLEILRLLKE